jgi:hypothetical protein
MFSVKRRIRMPRLFLLFGMDLLASIAVDGCDLSSDNMGEPVAPPGTASTKVDLPEQYEYVMGWGEPGTEPGQFNGVTSIAVAPDGTIYTGELLGLRVQRFTPMGDLLDIWGEPGVEPGKFVGIWGVAVAPWGEIYVSDAHPGSGKPARIQVFSPDGEFLHSFWQAGDRPHDFHMPRGLEIGPDGLLYVTDLNRGVIVFTNQGEFLEHWLQEPPLHSPSDIAFAWDPELQVEVAYIHASGPVKYEVRGDLLIDGSGSGYGTKDLAADPQNVFVCRRSGSAHIEKRDPALGMLALFGMHGTGPGEFTDATAVAVDDSGFVYAADGPRERIQKFRKVPETGLAPVSWSTLKRISH